ncbi:MAG TPA: glycosyltransferase family 4 protein [Candidatus Limnocylindrales bacterium]|jgi:glycosyltransferase involved in cell wall biosynthesis
MSGGQGRGSPGGGRGGGRRGNLARAARDAVYSLAGRLSPTRGEALLAMAKSADALLQGRRPPVGIQAVDDSSVIAPPTGVDKVAGRDIRAVEKALDSGDFSLAAELTERLLTRHPGSTRLLHLRRRGLGEMGDVTGRAQVLHRLHRLTGRGESWYAERAVTGRIIETTPGWLPHIPGPPRPVVPESDDVVLHLIKASVPYFLTGFTMRQRYNMLAAVGAGIRPVAITELGFPRDLGITNAPAYEVLDGIPHHHLDLGPYYRIDGPVDLVLEDQAWLMARLARQIRPAVIHASSGHRGYEFAIIGQALRAHIQRPLVYEVRSFFEATWTGDEAWQETGEQYHRRFETESRTMRAADHVITIAETMREEIIERGVDPDRVTVVPNAVDSNVFQPQAKDPELQRKYGLDGVFTFGYVSNIDHPREGHENLVDVTKILLQRGRRVRCLIVGDGVRAKDIRDRAKRAGVGNAVVFTGLVPHDQVAAHYALMDVFVVARTNDRAARVVTPLKPFEALAMGLPMIVADLPALREIAAPDERGLAYTPGRLDELADAIERLMDDPALGARIGEAGRVWVSTERRWADNGPRFREVYRRVLEDWNRRHGSTSTKADA